MADSLLRFSVNYRWLVKLRWVAVVGQLLTFGFASLVLRFDLVLWPMYTIIGLTVVSNLLLARYFRSLTFSPLFGPQNPGPPTGDQHILGLVMTMDMLSLTTLLYISGGPTNPFWVFFFVNVSLSAVLLEKHWAWRLNLLAVLCSTGLILHYRPVPELDQGKVLESVLLKGSLSLVQLGTIIGFALCSSVIVYFVTRVTSALRQQEADLRQAQQQQSRNEKLQALGTLAAGAAHELSTPLTTIALVAGDVEKGLQRGVYRDDTAGLVEEVRLIRQQLDRCRKILDRMGSHSGESVGEMLTELDLAGLFAEIREGIDQPDSRFDVSYGGDRKAKVRLPVVAFSQAVRGLIQNGIDASPEGAPVSIRFSRLPDSLEITIEDRGHGMPSNVLLRVSEPFFTTKPPGKGMGLGVFLARNVIEQLGGRVHIDSQTSPPGLKSGTMVTLTIPQTTAPRDERQIQAGSHDTH